LLVVLSKMFASAPGVLAVVVIPLAIVVLWCRPVGITPVKLNRLCRSLRTTVISILCVTPVALAGINAVCTVIIVVTGKLSNGVTIIP